MEWYTRRSDQHEIARKNKHGTKPKPNSGRSSLIRRGISKKEQRLDSVQVLPFGLLREPPNDTSAVGERTSHSKRDTSKNACDTL